MKLNIGCGDLIFPSPWVNCDLNSDKAEVICDARQLPFKEESTDEIYACHLIEHFNFKEAFEVLEEWKRVLQPDGWLVIETPDFGTSCREFLKAYDNGKLEPDYFYPHFFGMGWLKGGSHLFLYTSQQMRWTLEQLGFRNIYQKPALRYIGKENICMKFLCQR